MEQIELQAEKREVIGKQVRHLRREGLIPAILYGHNTKPLALQVEERALHRVLREAGANRLIALKIGRARKRRMTLAREIQRDAITQALLHVDFQEVVMTEKITTEVPLLFEGESPVVKRGEGILIHGLEAVEAECLPGDLISAIPVDLSILTEIDQAIHVGDLQVDPAIEILTDAEEIVAKVLPPRVVEKWEEVVEEEVPEVEVITEAMAEKRRAERPPEPKEEAEGEEEG
ncbi:MAG: 50S ribosomal protein L25 [Anaerolineae bacterium]